ncbi:hypothetical protein D3C81_1155280 [compost metagenome]
MVEDVTVDFLDLPQDFMQITGCFVIPVFQPPRVLANGLHQCHSSFGLSQCLQFTLQPYDFLLGRLEPSLQLPVARLEAGREVLPHREFAQSDLPRNWVIKTRNRKPLARPQQLVTPVSEGQILRCARR